MAIREGLWDCQYCGTKGILGRHKTCPNCARSRPEGTTFYLPEDEKAVENAALQEKAQVGPDWICEYCRSSNAADVDVCAHCSAPREGTSPRQQVKEYAPGEAPRSGDMTVPDPHEKYRQEKPARPGKERPRWLLPAAALLGVALLLVLGSLFFGSNDVEATAAGFNWERTVAVEALKTLTEEGWELPVGARLVGQREAIHHYDQVLQGYETKERQVSERVQVGQRTYVCGQRDLGNGFFEDVECTEPVYETQTRLETYQEPVYSQVPVYDTQYTYEVDRWVRARTERAAGNDRRPQWPEPDPAQNERLREREEAYGIIFVDGDGNRYEMELPEEEWRTFETGASYQLKVNSRGRVMEVVP